MTTTATPIGIILPIKKGESGYFEQSYDTFTQTKSNIINLLRTQPGERRFQPTFGTRLWSLNFEQNIDSLSQIAEKIITDDITRWIPNVEISNVKIITLKNDQTVTNKDIYRLNISVHFIVLSVQRKDVIQLVVEAGKI